MGSARDWRESLVLSFFIKGDEVMIIKWKISKYRKDKRHGAISPIKPSKYYKYLLEGVDRHEQKGNRASVEGLQLDDKRD